METPGEANAVKLVTAPGNRRPSGTRRHISYLLFIFFARHLVDLFLLRLILLYLQVLNLRGNACKGR